MISEGQIVLFRFPYTDLQNGKIRPALVISKLPGNFNDWLICMISSQTDQMVPEYDEIITTDDHDFLQSGLKMTSLFRICRLAVIDGDILLGAIGQIDMQRLLRIKNNLSRWIQSL